MSTLETLQDILVRDYTLTHEQVAPEAVLSALGLDSLSVLELMFKIEDRFHLKITGDTPTDLVTVNDVVRYIDGLLAAQAAAPAQAAVPGQAPVPAPAPVPAQAVVAAAAAPAEPQSAVPASR
jgi:acyl carrier protein